MKQKGFSLVILLIFLAILAIPFWFGVWHLLNSAPLFGIKENPNNTPPVDLSKINWSKGPFKIFFRTPVGLFSIKTDGKEKKMIFSGLSNYMLLDSSRKILLKTRGNILIADEEGKTQENIFTTEKNKYISSWRISPDEKKIAFLVVDENKWKNPKNRIPDEAYILNLETRTFIQLDRQKDLLDSEADGFKWINKSENIIVFTTKTYSENDVQTLYIIYELNSRESQLLGKQSSFLTVGETKPLSDFIGSLVAVETRISGGTNRYYYLRTSQDGTKRVTVENDGRIIVDGTQIMFWAMKNFKGFTETCRHPGWLPDNEHLVIECSGLKVIEVGTKRNAKLIDGYDAQWFDQRFEISDL
ncbi:hypothetical protein HYS97_00930 [Candidatus Daviesbacteria bacterium]|nr:hypothetical protein [Candidatus Daviesbacteria bacterium]